MPVGDHNEMRTRVLDVAYLTAPSATSHYRFRADRPYIVSGINYRFTTGSTSGTLAISRCRGAGSAGAIGTLIHSASTIDLSTTISADTSTNVALSTTAGALELQTGDWLAFTFGGTLTNLVGLGVSVIMEPIG